jgi:hypothetical protein
LLKDFFKIFQIFQMSINILIYQTYNDALWRDRMKEPMNDIKLALIPDHFFRSDHNPDWKVCNMTYPTDFRLPSVGQITCCLQYDNQDLGPAFNKMAAVAYKTIKYGKKFICKNPDPACELTRKDFDHTTWENFNSSDDELIWKLGTVSNNFILEIVAKKTAPIEVFKNYENNELYIYKPNLIKFHMNAEVVKTIEKIYAEGRRGVELPAHLK